MDNFTLTLNAKELDTVVAGLNELPIKVGLPTLQTIIQQVQAAQAPKPEGPLADKVVN